MARNLANLLSFFTSREGRDKETQESAEARDTCLACDVDIANASLYLRYRICPECRFHYTLQARERIDLLVDEGTFKEINRSITSLDPLSFSSRVPYRQRLLRDQRRTGLTEAVVTGTCSIGGTQTVLIVLDFGFLGGSMGSVVGEKVALAMELAARKKLPVVSVITSGGARIQEGILSLMQMSKTSTAVSRLAEKGLPLISVLANPATGQIFASFASLADIILAEPGALVGYAPLRVIAESSQEPLPPGSQTAEFHLEHGMLDMITDREHLKELLATLLDLLGTRYTLMARQKSPKGKVVEVRHSQAWESVQLARHEQRPSSIDYIGRLFTNFVELHGDRLYGDDRSVVCGLGHLGGQSVVIVGQERRRGAQSVEGDGGRTLPEGFRKAQRMMRLAARFQLPLITLIDTLGPLPSLESEERGLGNAIATSMALMADLPVPSISVIIGEGGSEGALALGIADRVLMLEKAIYSSISPEGAASLIYRDERKAPEIAESLKLTAADCMELRIVDLVVAEPQGGAHTDPGAAARHLKRILLRELAELQSLPIKRLLKDRYKKFRKMGEYSSHFRAAVSKEVSQLQTYVVKGVKSIRRRTGRRKQEAQSTEAEEVNQIPQGD